MYAASVLAGAVHVLQARRSRRRQTLLKTAEGGLDVAFGLVPSAKRCLGSAPWAEVDLAIVSCGQA